VVLLRKSRTRKCRSYLQIQGR